MSALAAGVSTQRQVLTREAIREVRHEQVHDGAQGGLIQAVEDDDLVDAVEELGPEGGPQRLAQAVLELLLGEPGSTLASCQL